MDHTAASRALDHVDALISQLERIKRAMQKAYAENNHRELQLLALTAASLRCSLMTEVPRYFVAGEYYTSYSEASARCAEENAEREPGNQIRIIDILQN